MTKYYIQAKTRTQADVFAAVGLARLLDTTNEPARIRLEGDRFVVEGRDIDEEAAKELAGKSLYRFIDDGKSQPPPGILTYDLAANREVEQGKREMREGLRKEIARNPSIRRDPETQSRMKEYAPDSEYRLHNVFVTMQADGGSNKALVSARTQSSSDTLIYGLQALGQPEAGTLPDAKLGASGNQLINPLVAKGSYGIKPLGTNRRNPGIRETGDNELLQYLRYAGYFSCAAPFFDKKGNVRLLVPVPSDISLTAFELLVGEFRRSSFGRSRKLKLDALASLRVAYLLIEHSEFAESHDKRFANLFMAQKAPADVVSGIYVSHYLKTSQFGRNVTELSFVAVPGWFPIMSQQDAWKWLEILDEHRRIIQTLNEDFSGEISLIQQYRHILQLREHDAFLQLIEFAMSYGAYWMSATNNPQRKFMPRFSTSNIERMAQSMAPNVSSILQDPGFQSIARAIRKSTVNVQVQNVLAKMGKGKKPWREIRYGLIAELNRKRFVKEELIESLSVFIAQYNAENARQREVKNSLQAAPPNVTTEDLESLARLVDETSNPALVGALLCAYGTCREPSAEPEGLRVAEGAVAETLKEEIEEVEIE